MMLVYKAQKVERINICRILATITKIAENHHKSGVVLIMS